MLEAFRVESLSLGYLLRALRHAPDPGRRWRVCCLHLSRRGIKGNAGCFDAPRYWCIGTREEL
jgi:hypothetical protein